MNAETAYLAAAYAYVAMRFRAATISDPPLMVVREDPKTGMDEWLPRHGLAEVLETPSPDFDMAELLFRTSISVDQCGHALWLIEPSTGRPQRLTPFTGREFEIRPTADRLRGQYWLKTARGQRPFPPEQIAYFHEVDPGSWVNGLSRLEVMLAWLNLGQQARATVRDLLENAIWPSVILQPDPDWNPGDEEFARYKAEANAYRQRKGGALPMVGGGTATIVSSRIRDLIPADLFNRVEAVTASVFGIPAIVLQFLVGMENSPWSQMAEARRMCYEDTIDPLWKEYEKRLTRQLLRRIDADATHFIRFDRSNVRALQKDKQLLSSIAVMWDRMASLNERRVLVGLEPDPDPLADEIPELETRRNPPPVPDSFGASLEGSESSPPGKALRTKARRTLQAALRADQIEAGHFEWSLAVHKQLELDREAVVAIARAAGKSAKADAGPGDGRRIMTAVNVYLTEESLKRWGAALEPLVGKTGRRAVGAVASSLGIRFDLLRPGLAAYSKREAAWLVKGIGETTRTDIAEAVGNGVQAGQSLAAVAKTLEDLPAFSKDRALLVARTESTRINNGAPVEALQARTAETGRKFLKRWNTAGDDRVRDEHAALEGETVGLDETFGNGLEFPSEPNCRCVLTYEEAPE